LFGLFVISSMLVQKSQKVLPYYCARLSAPLHRPPWSTIFSGVTYEREILSDTPTYGNHSSLSHWHAISPRWGKEKTGQAIKSPPPDFITTARLVGGTNSRACSMRALQTFLLLHRGVRGNRGQWVLLYKLLEVFKSQRSI
jgi:hypothetical protein